MAYRLIRVDITKGEQFRSQFLALSPNNKIPVIVDHIPVDGGAPLGLFESGEILRYLAENEENCSVASAAAPYHATMAVMASQRIRPYAGAESPFHS